MPDKGDTCPRCEETINSSTNEYTCETCGTTAFGICCGYAYGRCHECGVFICTDCTGYFGWARMCQECTPQYMKGREFHDLRKTNKYYYKKK